MNNKLPAGILLVDKPTGITSHDVIDLIRKKFQTKKVGHTGTLDPLATGLLVVLIGKKATKLSNVLKHDTKSYIISMELGYTSNELDTDGTITTKLDPADERLHISNEIIEESIKSFEGTYSQKVPAFSAVKIDGKKLYEYARAGKLDEIEIPSRDVTISNISDITIDHTGIYPKVQFTTTVSSGTYTRALVRDIGSELNIPTIQTALRRTEVGSYNISDAKTIEQITEHDIIPIEAIDT